MNCETCTGTGRITDVESWSVDQGKWKRSFEQEIEIECPECNGTGKESDE